MSLQAHLRLPAPTKPNQPPRSYLLLTGFNQAKPTALQKPSQPLLSSIDVGSSRTKPAASIHIFCLAVTVYDSTHVGWERDQRPAFVIFIVLLCVHWTFVKILGLSHEYFMFRGFYSIFDIATSILRPPKSASKVGPVLILGWHCLK